MGDKFVGWAALTQLVTEIKTRIAGRIAVSEKGASNGVATLDATGRVPYTQLPESAMEFKGGWNASTNNPELKDGIGTNGDFYVCNVAGTVNFGTAGSPRNVAFYVNDRALYDGTNHQWIRLPASEVRSVNGMSGDVTLSIPAAQVNSDWNASSGVAQILNKPSLATVATSGSYTDLSNKPSIPAAQVNSDWNATSGKAQILNKPSLATVATSGSYSDLSNKPTIPAAQVNSDWNASSGVAKILNKPSLATVATSGSYSDLSNKPTFPTVTDTIADGNSNAVSSNAVFNALNIPVAASTAFTAKSGFMNLQNILSAVYDDGVNPPVLYIMPRAGGSSYKTTDANWTTFSSALTRSLFYTITSLSIIGSTVCLGTNNSGLYYAGINASDYFQASGNDNFTSQTINKVALFNGKYYAATYSGLYASNYLSGTYSRMSYFSQMSMYDLVVFNNNLYIASGYSSTSGVGPLTKTSDGVNFTSLRDSIGGVNIAVSLCVCNNALYVSTYTSIYKTTDGSTFTQIYSGSISGGKLYSANDIIYFYNGNTNTVVTIKNDTVIASTGLLTNTNIVSVAYNRSSSLTFVTFLSSTAGQYYTNSVDYTPSQFTQELVNYLKTIFVQIT